MAKFLAQYRVIWPLLRQYLAHGLFGRPVCKGYRVIAFGKFALRTQIRTTEIGQDYSAGCIGHQMGDTPHIGVKGRV